MRTKCFESFRNLTLYSFDPRLEVRFFRFVLESRTNTEDFIHLISQARLLNTSRSSSIQ
jgi:hypothetical protein